MPAAAIEAHHEEEEVVVQTEEVDLLRRRRHGAASSLTTNGNGGGDHVQGENKEMLDDAPHLHPNAHPPNGHPPPFIEEDEEEQDSISSRSKIVLDAAAAAAAVEEEEEDSDSDSDSDSDIQNTPNNVNQHKHAAAEQILNTLPTSSFASSSRNDAEHSTITNPSTATATQKHLDANLTAAGGIVQEEEEDVVEELDLQRFLPDPEAYDLYCPSCNCCLKKVLLRKTKKQEIMPQQQHHEPVDVFRCISCFSFLILAGRRLVSLCAPGQKEELTDAGHSAVGESHLVSQTFSDQNGHRPSGPNPPVYGAAIVNSGASSEVKEPRRNKINSSVVNGTKDYNEDGHDGSKADVQGKGKAKIANAGPTDKDDAPFVKSRGDIPTINVSTQSSEYGKDTIVSITDTPEAKEVVVKFRGSGDAMAKTDAAFEAGLAETTIQTADVLSSRDREQAILEPRGTKGWDILKSIVYGGLTESITSLGIVTSAVGADADTVNILALGLANVIGGLFVLAHNLWELKVDGFRRAVDQLNEQVDRYDELLGRRECFILHTVVAALSFLICGVVPVVTYAFSFRNGDDRVWKLAAATAASLLCILVLATGKAHIQKPAKFSTYIRTVLYYACIGAVVSSMSYVTANLIMKVMDKVDWFKLKEVVIWPLRDTASLKSA